MAKKANPDPESATTQVNIADFQRTRDSVIIALATLQSSVQDLSRAYINHANTVLAPGRGGSLDANLTNVLTGSGLLGRPLEPMPAVEEPAPAEGKKKRKRAPHDPNAPKRALTPYFLYMQSARTQIAKELGDNAKPKEVADEGTRRWGEMSAAEKSVWDQLYQKNLAVYRVRMAAYKNHMDVPTDEEAARLVEAGKAPEYVAGVDPEGVAGVEAAESSDDASPEPPRAPSPPKSNKRRKTADKVATPLKETPKSAAKDKKTTKKAKKEATPPPAPASTSKPEKKKRAKKA